MFFTFDVIQQERMFTFWLQIVCVVVRCENNFFEGSVREKNVRELFGGVRGARLYNKNNARVWLWLSRCVFGN
jgi:hypothetical protein